MTDPRPPARLAGVATTQGDDAAPVLLALAHEFRTLASLRHPHVISVLDYGFESGQRPFFTMELLAEARPLLVAASKQTTPQRIRLLLQVLGALTYVHRRGVLHRDLKPANVLVVGDGDGAHVKVLDFGIACMRAHARRSGLAGTIAYMAPELFAGCAPSEASDLWAVAVMAYELLVGVHPFGGAGLVEARAEPWPPAPEDARLGPTLSAVLRRALACERGERYPDAASFGHDLAAAAGLSPLAETAQIRESFLSAAAFVAREAELSTLRRALDEAIAGRGSIWLVGGESGVGKSRLLDELRTFSLVHGTRVARGQAVSAGGGAFQIWQGALRPLCLDAELGDADAGALRAAVPDIAALLDRPVPDPPELDPQTAQARFIHAAEELLLARREPLLLLLEDLHWADPASLALLAHLARAASARPLLMVGSYRNDERPGLPDELPGTRRLPLGRLSREEMASLSTSMLGEVGERRDVVELLERETEGNAFFIVEVVRALADEVGALARVGRERVPSRVAAGGAQAVLARRLGRIPDGARPLLSAAAVLGRELDLTVLRALPEGLGDRVDAELSAASSVLEVSENRWRFAHDKLREALLLDLSDGERALWHRRIGEAIEAAYAGDLGPHAAALAHHFDRAGIVDRAARYQIAAGQRATRSGAVLEAIGHLERAAQLFDRVVCPPDERARSLGLLCRAYHGAGRPEECVQVLERMLADLGSPAPRSPLELGAGIARRAAGHARFLLGRATPRPPDDPARVACTGEVLDTMMAVFEVFAWMRSPWRIIHILLDFTALAERLRAPLHLAPTYAALGFVVSATPLSGLVDAYLRRARSLLAQAPPGRRDVRAHVSRVEAIVHIHRGAWDAARGCLDQELEDRRSLHDWRSELLVVRQAMCVELYRGRTGPAIELADRLDEMDRRFDNAQISCFARVFRAIVALRAGEQGRAALLLAEAEERLARSAAPVARILTDSLTALAALRRGDAGEARARADAALDGMQATPPMNYGLLEGPPAIMDVYAALWSRAEGDAERSELARRLDRSLAALRSFAALLPIARPRALLWHGLLSRTRGRTALAGWCLDRALEAAQRYRMPFDEALARGAIADVEDARGERERAAEHRRAAGGIFERLGAGWYVAELRARGAPA